MHKTLNMTMSMGDSFIVASPFLFSLPSIFSTIVPTKDELSVVSAPTSTSDLYPPSEITPVLDSDSDSDSDSDFESDSNPPSFSLFDKLAPFLTCLFSR